MSSIKIPLRIPKVGQIGHEAAPGKKKCRRLKCYKVIPKGQMAVVVHRRKKDNWFCSDECQGFDEWDILEKKGEHAIED